MSDNGRRKTNPAALRTAVFRGFEERGNQHIPDELTLTWKTQKTSLVERYPIIYVPGYGAPPLHGKYFCSRLEIEGFDVHEVRLPYFQTGDIPKSAAILSVEVQKIKTKHGAEKVNLTGHSLGGVIIRYYLQKLGGWRHVHRVVYLGTPHKGVYIAALGFLTKAGRQLMPNSDFMKELNNDPARCRNIKCLSIISKYDEVIVPKDSAILTCAYNKVVSWPLGHWGLVFSNKAIGWIVDFFDGIFDIREHSISIGEERAASLDEGCEIIPGRE